MRPIDLVLPRLDRVSEAGDGWKAVCPVHKGGTEGDPSLSVCVGSAGQVLFNCHAEQCSARDIATAIGLEFRQLFANGIGTQPGRSRPDASRRLPGSTKGNGKPLLAGKGQAPTEPVVTLSALALHVGLPAEFLTSLGLQEDRSGVAVPYYGATTAEVLHCKLRTSLIGKGARPKYVYSQKGTNARPYGLWRLGGDRRGGLVVVEGESDCWTLWHHRVPALGLPGASTAGLLEAEHLVGLKVIYVVQEPGDAGEKFARTVGERLEAIGFHEKVKVLRFGEIEKDPCQLHKLRGLGFAEDFRARCREAPLLRPRSIDDFLVDMETVPESSVGFLWRPYVPAGELTILMGKPGQGKGQITRNLAAALSLGAPLPGETEIREPVNVVLFSPEDRVSKVIKPSLRAAGADLSRIKAFDFNAADFTFSAENLDLLRQIHEKFKPSLYVFDPIVFFLEGVNMNQAPEMRARLKPLAKFAESSGAALLLVAHLNKGGSKVAIDRLFGSTDLSAIVRSVLSVDPDPRAKQCQGVSAAVLSHVKHNLSGEGPSLAFEIYQESDVPRVRWLGQHGMSVDEIVEAVSEPAGASKLEEARSLIAAILHGGAAVNASQIYDIARNQGISSSTLDRARRSMPEVETRKFGFGTESRFVWRERGIGDAEAQELPDDDESMAPF